MMCSRCKVRKAATASLLCLFCLGWPTGTNPQEHHHVHPVAAVISAPPGDHAEQPHPPEASDTQPVRSAGTEVRPVSYLTLDDPVRGQLTSMNVLAP
jgi:hypothetical protein